MREYQEAQTGDDMEIDRASSKVKMLQRTDRYDYYISYYGP